MVLGLFLVKWVFVYFVLVIVVLVGISCPECSFVVLFVFALVLEATGLHNALMFQASFLPSSQFSSEDKCESCLDCLDCLE